MTKSVKVLLESFDQLPDEAKREAAAEILRRTAQFNLPPLEDQALVEAADNLFLELDKRESKNA
jgi:hypothetical protein